MIKKKYVLLLIILIGITSLSIRLISKNKSNEEAIRTSQSNYGKETTESTQNTQSQVFDAKGNPIKVIGE
ncbi:hypothetical protein [Vagococcus hydrophili]|uniref:Uncharacterized protein n=1 Tax=Vagococcus hydrophili TaxID=2714947 RepID=A0A6G8AXD9_9ENTE|nr:hypothetical protein [Vagococcus hydrophili]QIL49553.1 hypothetical protein G7082_14110 [Vagococcus hydrophili]